MTKALISVTGQDTTGIIARVATKHQHSGHHADHLVRMLHDDDGR